MNGDFQIIAWIVFFVMGVIGGFMARGRRVGRLEMECHRLRSLVTAQLREVNGLEKELWNERHKVQNKRDMGDLLDGLRLRIRGIPGLPGGKVFRLKKIDKRV